MSEQSKAAWEGGRCQVPMWCGGMPAGHCNDPANGPQWPERVLLEKRNWQHPPYCFGPCCPKHGGPRDGEPIIFQDGYTPLGRPMYCAVMPGFVNLQESHASFDANPLVALQKLRALGAAL